MSPFSDKKRKITQDFLSRITPVCVFTQEFVIKFLQFVLLIHNNYTIKKEISKKKLSTLIWKLSNYIIYTKNKQNL